MTTQEHCFVDQYQCILKFSTELRDKLRDDIVYNKVSCDIRYMDL